MTNEKMTLDVTAFSDGDLRTLAHAIVEELAMRPGYGGDPLPILGDTVVKHDGRRIQLGDYDAAAVADGVQCLFLGKKYAADRLKGYRLYSGTTDLDVIAVTHHSSRIRDIINPSMMEEVCERLHVSHLTEITQVWVRPVREKDDP